MSLETLQFLWYVVVGVAMIMYVILDGFDLGVGMIHPFVKSDEERRILLNAIGPVWDGNEVWLVIILGALFAGFPTAYATVLSGYYSLVMVLIPGLIFRAAAIEFRSKRESQAWRTFWDYTFSVSSYVVSFILGILLANFILGIPLNSRFEYMGGLIDLFHPYAMLVALFGLATMVMHGSIYLVMKTEGELHLKIRAYSNHAIFHFLLFFVVTTIATHFFMPHMLDPFFQYPLLILVPMVMFFSIINVLYFIKREWDGWAFLSSCFSIALLLATFGIGTYPYLVRSTVNTAQNSLTVYNASSSYLTLSVLLIIVAMGVPLVLAYGYWVYYIFRGKVKLDEKSY